MELPQLSERIATKGKASQFGGVSPEQRLTGVKDSSCRKMSFSCRQSGCTSGFLRAAQQRQVAPQLQQHQRQLRPCCSCPGDRHWSCWAVVVHPSLPASPGLPFPLSALFQVFLLERLFPRRPSPAPFMCTFSSSENACSLPGVSPGHCRQEAI